MSDTATNNDEEKRMDISIVDSKVIIPVTVTDIDMPFMSMVTFMVKWAIAAIPSILILALIFSLTYGVIIAGLSRN